MEVDLAKNSMNEMSSFAGPIFLREQQYLHIARSQHLAVLVAFEQRADPHPWNAAQIVDELQQQEEKSALVIAITSSAAEIQTEHEIQALLFVRLQLDEAWIFNIVVDPHMRRSGLGVVLMQYAEQWARQQTGCTSLWLEVRASNTAAIGLYEKMGLCVVGRRKNYYPPAHGESKREDAILMQRAFV